MKSKSIEDLSILVVDDLEPMRLLMRKMLADLEAGPVRTAKDGVEALELIAEQRPDLIITDQQMEPMDGIEFVRALRAGDDPRARQLPVIMMTAFAETELLRVAVRAGVDDFLAKPISHVTLNDRIQRMLAKLSGRGAEVEALGKSTGSVAGPVIGMGTPHSTAIPSAGMN